MASRIKVAITLDYINCSTYIDINPITDTNNYEYVIEDTEYDHYKEQGGTIYNHTGNYLELVEKILHGRNMSS